MTGIVHNTAIAVASGEDARAGKPAGTDGACRSFGHKGLRQGVGEVAPPPQAWRGVRRPAGPAAVEAEARPRRGSPLAGLARGATFDLAVAAAAPVAAGLLFVPQAWCLASAIQAALVDGAPRTGLAPMLAGAAGLVALRGGLIWCGEVMGSRAGQRIAADLRTGLLRKVLDQRPSWVAARASGALAAAVTDQAAAFEAFFGRYVPALVAAAVLPLAFAGASLAVDPIAGLLVLLTAPLIVVFMALVGMGAEAVGRQHQQAFLRLSGLCADRLRGLLALKLLGRAGAEADRLRGAGDELCDRTNDVLRIAFLSSAVLEFFAAVGVAGVALYVGLRFLGFVPGVHGTLTLRSGLFCLLLTPEAYLPLRYFASAYHDRAAAKAAVASLESLFEGLPAAGRTAPPGPPVRVPRSPCPVAAIGLAIDGPGRTRRVLGPTDLAVPAGARIAILGASGAGKSTLIEALAGLRAFEGRIALGGRPIGTIPEAELRARVAFAGQRPHLFHGTIEDNIRLGSPGASRGAVLAAAASAGVMRFAARLPAGLATRVGDGGLGLSGGEAHRVGLARAFLRDPDLLLLDEPTAHLDPVTEQAVIAGILAFAAGRTMVVATHSAALAARLDRAYRIEAGLLVPVLHRPLALYALARRAMP